VYDGHVEYWPHFGHGRWGKPIHMEHSPRFPYGYDPRRILVGDVDGDGLADIVYVEDTKVTLWINQSGNGWSDPITILGTPPVSDIDAVRLVDVLGSGISGVLWSRDANGVSRGHLFFLDFTGGLKPYLLHEMDNHIGAVTKVEYAPSIRFYLEDQRRPATQWKTTLPFPVHVVSRVEVIGHFSKGKLTTEYQYHHGYWDGAEREFRGFGMVEQRDTESFETYESSGLHGAESFFAKVDRHYEDVSKVWMPDERSRPHS
jgi:glycosyltransferase TcdB-like subunit of Tc toxin